MKLTAIAANSIECRPSALHVAEHQQQGVMGCSWVTWMRADRRLPCCYRSSQQESIHRKASSRMHPVNFCCAVLCWPAMQSLYTGVYARGGPVTVEPQFDLSAYLDRSAGTDARGVKKSATPK